MSAYEDLLKELGEKIGTTLRPDNRNCCRLIFGDGLAIQIDLDSSGDKILCGCNLGTIPPGAYRERLFKQALMVNGLPNRRGNLAFSAKNDALILFQYLPLSTISGERLHKVLLGQAEHARVWIDALRNGQIPLLEQEGIPSKSGYMGMR